MVLWLDKLCPSGDWKWFLGAEYLCLVVLGNEFLG